MSTILNAARVAAALNIGLLLVLLVVWGRTFSAAATRAAFSIVLMRYLRSRAATDAVCAVCNSCQSSACEMISSTVSQWFRVRPLGR